MIDIFQNTGTAESFLATHAARRLFCYFERRSVAHRIYSLYMGYYHMSIGLTDPNKLICFEAYVTRDAARHHSNDELLLKTIRTLETGVYIPV